MLRLPGDDLLDPDVVEDYCVGEQLSARITNGFTVLDFTSEDDAGDFDHDAEALLSTIVGVRAELAAGDLRSLYIAGWPPTADGSGTSTPSTATPTTISSPPCRLA